MPEANKIALVAARGSAADQGRTYDLSEEDRATLKPLRDMIPMLLAVPAPYVIRYGGDRALLFARVEQIRSLGADLLLAATRAEAAGAEALAFPLAAAPEEYAVQLASVLAAVADVNIKLS